MSMARHSVTLASGMHHHALSTHLYPQVLPHVHVDYLYLVPHCHLLATVHMVKDLLVEGHGGGF